MAEAARGQLPVDQRLPNRTITIPLSLGVGPADTLKERRELFLLARARLQTIVARIQTDRGVLWRGGSGRPGLYADLVDATADVVLTLQAIPDFYGEETERRQSTSTGTDLVLTEHGILGDYPGRVRIVLTD